jgi:hypothetical protein
MAPDSRTEPVPSRPSAGGIRTPLPLALAAFSGLLLLSLPVLLPSCSTSERLNIRRELRKF